MIPSRRIAGLPASGTLSVSQAVRARRARSEDIINLGGGAPDPGPPLGPVEIDLAGSLNSLNDPAGLPEVRAGIARRLATYNGLDYDPERQIALTVGAKYGVLAALMALVDPGDKVVVLDPSWPTYAPAIQIAGADAVRLPLAGEGFALEAAQIAAVPWREIKGIILNSPHNPTGRVFDANELEQIAARAREHDLWIISDESFDSFVYGGRRHVSIATLADMAARTIVVNSFSKSFALPGLRIGYLAGPEEIVAPIVRFLEQTISCVSPMLQKIALDALAREAEWRERLVSAYAAKIEAALEIVGRDPRIRCAPPQGTFYLFPRIEGIALDGTALHHLALEHGVAMIPGSAFGAQGEGHVRFNLVGRQEDALLGLRRFVELMEMVT